MVMTREICFAGGYDPTGIDWEHDDEPTADERLDEAERKADLEYDQMIDDQLMKEARDHAEVDG